MGQVGVHPVDERLRHGTMNTLLEDGLQYPFRGEWVGRLIIGGGLTFISISFFPLFLVAGNLYRIVEQTVTESDDTPPAFDDWNGLFIKGIGVWAIVLTYAVLPVVYIIVVVAMVVGIGWGGEVRTVSVIGGILLALLAIPLFAITYYFIPVAIAHYASVGELKAAFDVRTLTKIAFTREYFTAVVL